MGGKLLELFFNKMADTPCQQDGCLKDRAQKSQGYCRFRPRIFHRLFIMPGTCSPIHLPKPQTKQVLFNFICEGSRSVRFDPKHD